MPWALSGLKPEPSMIEPGTQVAPWKPPGPTPWTWIRLSTMTFSVYSPRGARAVGVAGWTTTSAYGAVDRARSAAVTADWMVR